MAQPWAMRYMLVDGQGNYGSVDGDSAAAMRYTECRLQKIGEEMMQDLDKETVDMQTNFDELIEHICSRLFVLPNETVVYPGHGAPTTIGMEKAENPFFR
jgi:hypothetical protein